MALAPQQFCVRWNSYHTNLQAVFPRLLSTEYFADVTLACESRQIKCHKIVLSACSAYFERLLVQNPCKHPIVFMKDMRHSEMQALVDFMYKGEVNVTQDELPSLLKSAEALQIRGLCSSDPGTVTSDLQGPKSEHRDYSVASDALVAQAHYNCSPNNGIPPQCNPTTNGPTPKKRKSEDLDRPSTSTVVKEETVEEDGLYYGDIDNDNIEYNEDDDSGKPGSNLSQPSACSFIRVKPECELFNSQLKNDPNVNKNMPKINPMHYNYNKYSYNHEILDKSKIPEKSVTSTENDYYKQWLEQNGELEVSLLRAGDKSRKPKVFATTEVELISKGVTKSVDKQLKDVYMDAKLPQMRRRGRPPIFKEKATDLSETVLKSDLDQFLAGKEVSSSGLSRKDLERVMMGKYNPNRRYSNEAMWAALMDVKQGGSIYRAAQTHKVPRKSLRNWMKRCQIKSSFPMPQQLKQFVENSKKQKEYRGFDDQPSTFDGIKDDEEFGNHFLMATMASSEDENALKASNTETQDGGDKTPEDKPIDMPVSTNIQM